MSNFKSTDTISGKFGKLFIDGEEVAYIKSFEATVTKKKVDVPIVGAIYDGKKTTGLSGAGIITLYKVTTNFAKAISDYATSGKDVYFTAQCSNNDPSSGAGTQRITLYNCNTDSVKLSQLDSAGAILEEALPFTFEKYDIQDSFIKL